MALPMMDHGAVPPLPLPRIGASQMLHAALRHPGRIAAVVWWYVTGRRMRAKGHLARTIASLPFAYDRWLADCAAMDASGPMAVGADGAGMGEMAVHLHLAKGGDPGGPVAASASVLAQSWPHWRLIVTREDAGVAVDMPSDPRMMVLPGSYPSRAEGLRAALGASGTVYLVPLDAATRLPRDALAVYASWIQEQDRESVKPVLYGDQDEIAAGGRRARPWFKPGWDADMFMAQDYLSAACALPVDAALNVCGPASGGQEADEAAVYAILLRLAVLAAHPVRHLHRVTATCTPDGWRSGGPARIGALREVAAPVLGFTVLEGPFGTADIVWPLPEHLPLVSIVVPTRDRLDLLQPCIEGVLERTRYPAFEIVIADNGSIEPETLDFFMRIVEDARVRVVSWPHPYNYSAINNFAVESTRGAFVCLLNNDIEIIDGDWLGQMMRHACRPGVGAVGARLLYPDHSIQHAGVAVGMGNAAGHAHRGQSMGEPGYFAHALVTREATAVTAACLVVSRSLFDAVDGLDEHDLRIAYNDVDFCLKLRATGARNIYVPRAVLIHHESKSRGQDMAPEHRERYLKELAVLQGRWDTMHFCDPTHHPVLDRSSETYRPGGQIR